MKKELNMKKELKEKFKDSGLLDNLTSIDETNPIIELLKPNLEQKIPIDAHSFEVVSINDSEGITSEEVQGEKKGACSPNPTK